MNIPTRVDRPITHFIDTTIKPLLTNDSENIISQFISRNERTTSHHNQGDTPYQELALTILYGNKSQPQDQNQNINIPIQYSFNIFDNPFVSDINRHIKYEREISKFVPVVTYSLVKCRNCKSDQVMISQIQTSSGDEGFTNKMRCLTCRHKWSERN